MPHSTTSPESIPDGYKYCSRCGEIKPRENFSRQPSRSDGLQRWCKQCYAEYARTLKDRPKIVVETKTCSSCGQTKPAVEFERNQKSRDGLNAQCKNCTRESKRKYRQRPEVRVATLARCATYRKSEAGQRAISEYNYRYNRNPEVKARRRKLMASEKYRAYKRNWFNRNKEYAKKIKSERRAREYNAPGSHTENDIRLIYESQRGRCWYCQKEIAINNMHIDHRVPLSRGGSNDPDNLVATCAHCNLSKNNRLPHEWCGRLL